MDKYKARIGKNPIMCSRCGSNEFYIEQNFYDDIYDLSSPYKRIKKFYLEAQCSNCGSNLVLSVGEWDGIEFYRYTDEIETIDNVETTYKEREMDKASTRYMETNGSEIFIRFKNEEEIHLSCAKEDLEKNYDKGKFYLNFECTFLSEDSLKAFLSTITDKVDTLVMRKGFIEGESNEMELFEFSFVGGRLRYEKIRDGMRYKYKFKYTVGIESSKADFRKVEENKRWQKRKI